MSNLGEDFDRAQRRYDKMTPPDEDDYLECSDCGEEFIPEFNLLGEIKHYKCQVCRELEENKTDTQE